MSSSAGRSLCITWAGDGIDGAESWNYMTPNQGGKFMHVSVLSSYYCVELKLLVLLLLSLNWYCYHVILSPLIVQWAR